MQTTDFFTWGADPTVFNLGVIELPFPISIWGIVLAAVAFFYGAHKLLGGSHKVLDKTGESQKADHPPIWKFIALGVAALVGGQLIFLAFPSFTLSEIGPIKPRWYGVLFASSFVIGYIIMHRMYKEGGRTQDELDKLLNYVIIATIVGARLGHVIFYDLELYLRYPAQILAVWNGGLASHGAAIGIILAMYLYVKKVKDMSFLWLADRVVIVVAIAGAFIRTGNFINSEIVGQPTDLPWAVIFERAPSLSAAEQLMPRHPTMLYEALLCVAIFGILWMIYKRYQTQPPEGAIFGSFLALLFGGRFFLEFTKIPQAAFASSWTLNMGQWLSIPLVAAGIWLLWKKVDWSKKPVQKKNDGSSVQA
ncbi:MAG: prolipoprotein diacylglyceryl transferase [Balneolaceae bacterium]|nr:prolipoprotein diacylglyceryl transferase [Balneolaceae bacterium]